ncbi:MAG: hypothetical protein ACK5U8_01130, partial [Deltaproteobacteria bacterium]
LSSAHEGLDLRTVSRVLASRRGGALEQLEQLAPYAAAREAILAGRAGRRLALLESLTTKVLDQGARLFAGP